MNPIKIILNPIAGRGHGARVEPDLRRFLQMEKLDFDLVRTQRPWHAAELAEQAARDGFETIVAAGGDGTSHEVLNGLMAAANGNGIIAAMGILPVGSGSDFANTMGISHALREACRQLARSQVKMVDVGQVSLPGHPPRYFDNTVNVGFGGIVTREARKIKRLRGMALYLPVVLKTVFLHHKPLRVTIGYDERTLTLRTVMITIANGSREGGSFFVAPKARPDDGLFDICIVHEIGRLGMLGMIPHFMKGSHVGRETITMARARRVTISSPDDLIAHVDGEMLCTDAHRIEFDILPQRLPVRR